MTYDFFSRATTSFFQDKHWAVHHCKKCHRSFLSKGHDDCCGSLDCFGPWAYDSMKYKPHNAYTIKSIMQQHFIHKGYSADCLTNVKNNYGDTAVIVAALQYFNKSLGQEGVIDDRMLFCPQPCLRLRPFPKLYYQYGFLHAFVNAATLKLQAQFSDYLRFLDDWIDLLSSLGIHASRLRIVLCSSYVNIHNMYCGWGVDINICGLELGCCNYYDNVVIPGGSTTTGIDCGFCIERILWILNNGPFGNSILPLDLIRCSSRVNLEFEDAIRSATLMVMSGIIPGPRNDSYQLKKLLNCIVNYGHECLLIDANIEHYYSFWQIFLKKYLPLSECKRIILRYLRQRYIQLGLPTSVGNT